MQALSSASPVGVVGPVSAPSTDPTGAKQPPVAIATESPAAASNVAVEFLRQGARPRTTQGGKKSPPAKSPPTTKSAPAHNAKGAPAQKLAPAQTEKPKTSPAPDKPKKIIRLVRGDKVVDLPQSYKTRQARALSPTLSEVSMADKMKHMKVGARPEAMETGNAAKMDAVAESTPTGPQTDAAATETQTQTTSAASSLSGQMPPSSADGSVAEGAEAVNPDLIWQQPQEFRMQSLPWATRNLAYVHKLLIAWMAILYSCPYPECNFKSTRGIPAGTKKTPATEDYILRPDRHSDFLEHWWTTHMETTLKFQCIVPGCKLASRIYKIMANFIKHVRTHYPGSRSDDKRVLGAVNICLETFADKVGDAPNPNDVDRAIVYPPKHIGIRQYRKIQEEESRQNEAAARAHARTLELPRTPPRPTTTNADRKRPTTSTTGSAHSGKVSRVERPCRIGPLVEGSLRTAADLDRCNAEDVALIHKAFGRINYVYGFGVKEQLDIAKAKMEVVYYNKMVVWKELDTIRVALARYRNDLDGGVRSLSAWQSSLLPDEQTHCPKVLVHSQVLQDAQRLTVVERELEVSNNTNVRLGRELQLAQIRIRELEAELVAAPTGAGAQPRVLPPVALGAPNVQRYIPIQSNEAPSIQAMLVQLHNLVGMSIDEGQLAQRLGPTDRL